MRALFVALCLVKNVATSAQTPPEILDLHIKFDLAKIKPSAGFGLARCHADRNSADIMVCGSTKKADPNRLPLRDDVAVGIAKSNDVRALTAGASGIGSCSASGPGGIVGCSLHEWKAAAGKE